MFEGKKVLICVSGGIAVYKSLELVRFFKKSGVQIKVVMSENARKFVTALSFETLSENPVLFDGAEEWGRGISHIAYASWCDVCILAPATINSLSKFAYGIADNVMLSTLIACKTPIIIAPSANTQMYLSLQAQENLSKLRAMGHIVVEPKEGLLACGVYGTGAMAEVEEIGFCALREIYKKDSFWNQKKVILSGGGSSEDIDDVRCITNHSSGLQASYLALALFVFGAEVVFVSSKFPIFLPSKIKRKEARTTQEYFEAISGDLDQAQYYFGVAALSDFLPKQKYEGKIKKQDGLKIDFVENFDILKNLCGIKKIGFKAEKDIEFAKQYAQKMLVEKECECVCLNIIGKENPFGGEKNSFYLIGKNAQELHFALSDKFHLAFSLLDGIAKFIEN